MKKLISLMVLVLVSGCVLCEGDMAKLLEPAGICKIAKIESFDDNVVKVSTRLVPGIAVYSGDKISLAATIENVGEKDIPNVRPTLFDYESCKAPDTEVRIFKDGSESATADIPMLYKGYSSLIEWEITARNVNMDRACTLSYKVDYDYETDMIKEIVVATPEEITRRKIAGISFPKGETFKTPGPVQLEIEIEREQPLRTRSTQVVYVKAKQVVSDGFVSSSQLDKVKIFFPYPVSCSDGSCWDCDGDGGVCFRPNQLKLYDGETESVSYVMNIGDDVDVGTYKSKTIQASTTYTFEIRDSRVILIQPLS